MEKFYKNTNANTIPLLLYLVASFTVVFVSNINFLVILFVIFIGISAILFNRNIVIRILLISIFIIPLIIFLSMLFSWEFSYQQAILILPKSISFSIIISSAIAFFLFLPTYQLFRISKTIIKSSYPAYALLAGFRTFPVFFHFSKKIFVAIKIRKAYSSYFDFVMIYFQNIFIEFLNFLDDFITRFSFLNLKEIKVEFIYDYKTIISVIYLLITFTLAYYE